MYVVRMDQGRTVEKVFLRVNWREVGEGEEGEDLDCDGWKMLRRICGR